MNYPKFVEQSGLASGKEKEFEIGMGLAGEAGEVCDYLKKCLIHGKPMERKKLVEELGDVRWYLQLACNTYGIPMEELERENIIKLCERYPHRTGKAEDWLQDTDELKQQLKKTYDYLMP